MDNKLQSELKEYANRTPNEEVCGLIYQADGREWFYPTKNSHSNKKHFFRISPLDYIFASDLGDITAIFHSHINDNSNFSGFDYAEALGHHLNLVLFSVKTQEFRFFDCESSFLIKYLNRAFVEGENDCFTLISEFYKNELNILIPDFFPERAKDFVKIQREIIQTNQLPKLIKDSGFTTVDKNSLKEFDILIFNFDNRLHFGICLGNCLLHQPRGKESCIEELDNEYLDRLICGVTHG